MKNFAMTVVLVALFAAGSANAAVLYDTVDIGTAGTASNFTNVFDKTFGGPLGDSFSVSSPTLIKGVNLVLWDVNAKSDGGSTLVYLVPDNGSNLPIHTGLALNLADPRVHLLGTISDSTLPTSLPSGTTGATAVVNQGGFLITTPGRYWIELVASTDPINGGTAGAHHAAGSCAAASLDPLAQCTRWVFNTASATGTVGVTGEFTSEGMFTSASGVTPPTGDLDSFVNGLNGNGEFEMKINTPAPEPTTLAILGAGLLGLGLSRRRRAKKPTE